MSFFETLKKAIFYNPMAKTAGATSPPAHAPRQGAPTAQASPAAAPSAASAQPQPVDVEAVLEGLNAKSAQKLNWRTSIVDLMKLVGVDSSLQHRQELATELGYTGDKNDSAAMNIWLHKAVMRKLAENGGKVPASLQ
jgi:3-oxoacyl-ACP reductase-like protein